MNSDQKDLIDQGFENGIGYESDLRQLTDIEFGKKSILLVVNRMREESDRDSYSNFIFSNCLPRYRNFNSTTFNK
jgi:hypothetical protein